jgi:purine-binding chemotaxis protein CheW
MSEQQISELDQYLTFTLGDELFALDIASVREILDDTNITRIPRTPEFMRGVLNVRGHAVPVVDLRLKFGMSRSEMTVNTCVIITEVEMEGERAILGALADSVQEVVEMPPSQIDPAPRMGAAIDVQFIKGMGKRNDRFIIILDIDRVFSAQELAAVSAAGGGRPAEAEAAESAPAAP